MNSKYTKELLEPIVNRSESIGQVLDELNLKRTGGNYQNIQGHFRRLDIDTSHFTGQGWNKNNHSGKLVIKKKRPLSEILVENSIYTTSKLRKRLIEAEMIKNKCEWCGIESIWNDKPITLQLDHINGNRNDNRIENLRLLCPNCHSQTETHSARK